MTNEEIAVIGGGFSGFCVASNLIKLLKNKKKHVSITLFDPNGVFEGVAYNTNLPDCFQINHEANYMGIINPFSSGVKYDDFYKWIQENKKRRLAILDGDSISTKYKEFALNDPNSHLPRSLYGYYLKYRFEELLLNSKSEDYNFKYKACSVTNIEKIKDGFKVFYEDSSPLFSVVVLCTGDYYNYDEKNLLYSSTPYSYLNNRKMTSSKEIGILGSSLSGVETAIALAERGFKKITMFSRNGRLPKIRGKVSSYKPKYINASIIKKIKGESNTIEPKVLIGLLKREFDNAYRIKRKGLYQKEGINWQEIIFNKHPLKQLNEDIKTAQAGKEMIWRSVLLSLQDIEMDFWDSLSTRSSKKILDKYASFILIHFSPMPLLQAEKLQAYLKTGVIKLSSNFIKYLSNKHKWTIYLKGNKKVSMDYLIDARGYSQDASKNLLLTSLISSGLLEKHPVYGIRASKKFQIIKNNKIIDNLYAIGAMLNGERPLKASTPYITQFAKEIAHNIVKSI